MFTAYVIVTLLTILANAAIAAADFARVPAVVANGDEVNLPRTWLPKLATLKVLGVAGLALGLAGAVFTGDTTVVGAALSYLGLAAATGLVLFYLGAVAFHVRARVFHNIAFPGAFLALAVGSLVLAGLR